MTYDLYIVNREELGLKPRDEMTADDWRVLWERAEKQSPGKACQWEVTGTWGCGWGWVKTITDFCAPILDGPEPLWGSLHGLKIVNMRLSCERKVTSRIVSQSGSLAAMTLGGSHHKNAVILPTCFMRRPTLIYVT